MAVLKCKMCGGDIVAEPGATYGACDSCGSVMTLPRVDGERRANLFNRANHFRRSGQFDKAVEAYEAILNEDDRDAEAHWGVALSRFGIDYVEDPKSRARIPTCHRARLSLIVADPDYLAALENAPDAHTRELYEQEGQRIADIQRGILEVSRQEAPCDVFICYKETDQDGQRTLDSALAQELHDELQQAGYRVFFARVSLEDKLGREYEPYIFAALTSARVMLVVGTRAEHFAAVWVQNEWRRYLELMAQHPDRLLIPCYRDMDPYELPDELSIFQSLDMGRIGFFQDLLRVVGRALGAKQAPESAARRASGPAGGAQAPRANREVEGPSLDTLLERGRTSLRRGDLISADRNFERALDVDDQCAAAYWGRLMVALGVREESAIAPIYNRAFEELIDVDPQLQGRIEPEISGALSDRIHRLRQDPYLCEADFQCLQQLKRRYPVQTPTVEQAIKEFAMHQSLSCELLFQRAVEAADKQESMHYWSFVYETEQFIDQKLDRARQEDEREAAAAQVRYQQELEKRVEQLEALAARYRLEGLTADRRMARQARRQRRDKRIQWLKTSLKQHWLTWIAAGLAVVMVLAVLIKAAVDGIPPMMAYSRGEQLLQDGNTEGALAEFRSAGDYNDAWERTMQLLYQRAQALYDSQDYDEASKAFRDLGNYQDARQMSQKALFEGAKQSAQRGDYETAFNTFSTLGDYEDAPARMRQVGFQLADQQLDQGNAMAAAGTLYRLGDGDEEAVARRNELYYAEAQRLLDQGLTLSAKRMFERCSPGYQDREARIEAIFQNYPNRIAAGGAHTVWVEANGRVRAVGDNAMGQLNVAGLSNVLSVAAGDAHTLALLRDGTVEAVGQNDDRCRVSGWSGVTAIAAGREHSLGLMETGSAVATGSKKDQQCSVSGWSGLVAIAAGGYHSVGLKEDGTVVAVGRNMAGQCNVQQWTDVVAVAAGDTCTVGLRADGTVLVAGEVGDVEDEVERWTGITAIAAGRDHVVGLKADGTVVAAGRNDDGQCDVADWTGIEHICAGPSHTVGQRRSGSLVAVGRNMAGQCNVP